jgi:sulfur relay (sulfurtransferase) DsrF/TusC family protein
LGDNLCLIIRKAPFGSLHAAEGIRLANGKIAHGGGLTIVLVDDGVYVAKKGQRAEESGWTSLSDEVTKLSKRVRTCVHIGSLKSAGLQAENLVDGIIQIGDQELVNIIADSDSTIIL